MTPKKEIIKKFFEGEKQYSIPVYQRAYSWDKKQWKCFLDDLEEATKGDNHYFFGNILFEKLSSDEEFDIIDGQQRITTIVIFTRALHNVLKNRAVNDKFLDDIEKGYLIYNSKPKLEAVEYDRDYFKNIIIENLTTHEPQTPSQIRIKEAKEFFTKKLNKKDTPKLLEIFEAMKNAEILSIFFENKKDSVLMFELQNNRGKKLTNMEKLKSYFAYQIYTYCNKEESEIKLNEITNIFKEIYRIINDIKNIGEDSVLNYYNISKFGFTYRENDDELNYKKEFNNIKEKTNEYKISWIEDYMKELKEAFVDFKEFQNHLSIYKDYLIDLNVWEVYPFILKAYRLFREDKDQLEQVFHALEIIAFRHKLVKTGADFGSRLNKVLKNFTNIENLKSGFKEICIKEWYWSDDRLTDSLINIYKLHKKESPFIQYIFMRYENHLRKDNAKTKGYLFSLKDLKEPEIEHIAPITENGEELKSGYCEYTENFSKESLHCIGNLLLIDKSHNCSIGNRPFEEKLQSYENPSLIQQREIKDFVKTRDKILWDKDAIDERHKKIYNFILKTWSFEAVI